MVVTIIAVAFVLTLPAGGSTVTGLPYAIVGTFLVVRRPTNAIGWVMYAIALVGAVNAIDGLLAGVGVAAGWVGLLGSLTGTATLGLLFLLTVVFPAGRLPGGRSGVVVRAELALLIVSQVLLMLGATIQADSGAIPNPIGLLPADPTIDALTGALLGVVLIAMFVTAVTLMTVRLRRSVGVERQQLKWVIASLVALAGGFAIGLVSLVFLGDLVGDDIWIFWIPAALAFPLPPIAVGVAVTRFHLYEIDRIINRALVYGALTAILAGIFAALALVTQRVFIAITGQSSDASVVLATLSVATLYTPVRKRLEALIDRRFKYAQRRFGAYRDELERALALSDPVRAARRLALEAARELGARGCAVVGAADTPTATAGEWPVSPLERVAIPGGHDALESILVGPRTGGHPYDPGAIADLQELAGAVVAAVDLHSGQRPR